MFRALLYKELRETLWIGGLALLAYLNLVSGRIGVGVLPWSSRGDSQIPFASNSFLLTFAVISSFLAISLGFRQSLGESLRGTWSFLLHRPVTARRLMAAKLATGMLVYLSCAALPILLYAWWAATPGHHASPFEWSMTLWSWQAWLSCTAVYLGAFLSGIRSARWYGSRLCPLLGMGLVLVAIQALPWWWWLGTTALLLLDACLIACILAVAQTRDY